MTLRALGVGAAPVTVGASDGRLTVPETFTETVVRAGAPLGVAAEATPSGGLHVVWEPPENAGDIERYDIRAIRTAPRGPSIRSSPTSVGTSASGC